MVVSGTRATIAAMEHRLTDRSTRTWIAIVAVALIVVACGQATPTPTPAPTATPTPTVAPSVSPLPSPSASASLDPNAVFDEIERQVIAIRGLKPTAAVDREIIDEPRLRDLLTAMYDEDNTPAVVAANERLYKALGLIPADASLRALSLDLMSSGVAGFYRDDEKKMYVVARSGAITPADRITYAHEYTHALQDQHWSVFKDQKGVTDRGDWYLGRAGVYEGDATLLMTYWAQAHLTMAELLEAAKVDPAAQAILDGTPAILREPLLYPYTTGLQFSLQTQITGGWPAVDALYDKLPTSTEQVMHPESYLKGDQPVDVQLPAKLAKALGAGWSTPLLDTFGELQTGIWLKEGGVPAAQADDAAAGWGGDRLAVIEGPDGAWAIAWHTAWDTTADAAAFETAATTALAKAGGVGQVVPGEGGLNRWVVIGDGAKTLDHVAGVLGLAG